jgi:predicted transcriptional regulator
MKKEEIVFMEELFFQTLQDFQGYTVDELIKTHKEFLPRHIVINTVSRVSNLIHYALEGNVKYFVVVSSEGEIAGLIKAADLIYLLVAGAARYSTFSGISRIGILGKEIPIGEAIKLVAEEIMRWGPTVTTPDDNLRHVLKLMWDSRAHAVIIVDEEKMPIAVIDEDAVLSMVSREVLKRIKLEKAKKEESG